MIRLATAACVAAFFLAGTAAAQSMCGAHDRLVEMLTGPKYSEALMVEMAQDGKAVIQIYSNPKTQTWTVLLLRPGGMACIAAAGNGFEIGKAYVPGQGT